MKRVPNRCRKRRVQRQTEWCWVTEAAVEFGCVGFKVGGRTLLHGVSFRVEPGSTVALLGRSGSGKTTLLRMVNGLVMPGSGTVRVGDRPTTEWNTLELRRSIGYVIQESGLFPHWTVERNAGLALELAGRPDLARVSELLGMAGLDGSLAMRFPWQLSGGQRQRVGLARALAGDPGVLLMDEPFGALDPITRSEMQTMLKDLLARVRKTVLLVTHDLSEAMFLAERLIFLEQGEVVADLRTAEVGGSANPHVRQYLAAIRHPVVT